MKTIRIRSIALSAIVASLVSVACATPTYAWSAAEENAKFEAEFDAIEARRQANSQIVKQNKALYEATASPLIKQVDNLLESWEWADSSKQAILEAQLQQIMSENMDTWATQFYRAPLSDSLPVGTTLVKSGYKYDYDAIVDGDLRPWIWVFENGKLYVMTMNALSDVKKHGGFAAQIAFLENPPTGGYFINDAGGITYWGDVAEAMIAQRGY